MWKFCLSSQGLPIYIVRIFPSLSGKYYILSNQYYIFEEHTIAYIGLKKEIFHPIAQNKLKLIV